jgi:hypothetical protein
MSLNHLGSRSNIVRNLMNFLVRARSNVCSCKKGALTLINQEFYNIISLIYFNSIYSASRVCVMVAEHSNNYLTTFFIVVICID